jgi:uncharacterized protein YggE
MSIPSVHTRPRKASSANDNIVQTIESPLAAMAETKCPSSSRTRHVARSRTLTIVRIAVASLAVAVLGVAFLGISADTSLVFGQLVPRETGEMDGSPPSLVVTGYGRASAPAETAVIQFLMIGNDRAYIPPIEFRTDLDPVAPGEVPAAVPIIDALVTAGVGRGDIRVTSNPMVGGSDSFDSTTVVPFRLDMTVRAPTVEQISVLITAVHNAGHAEGLLLGSVGVSYRIGDCLALQKEARRLAMADGKERAIQQAEVAEADLISLTAVEDLGPPSGAACAAAPVRNEPRQSWNGSGGITLPAFDPTSPAEAKVEAKLMLAYELR